ncbi:MAG: 16S rRNA (cytosine(1402)-N(4))-methyltransferase RsmH [Clostridia bacterium]|nr:16S rRNA (cytosine(1402)-N(4))-methyltransferase RsmH [Clostridia bacterium]
MEFSHIPVLLNETIDSLNLKDGGVYVDCTLGGAGHSKVMLETADISLIGIDQDITAINVSKERLKDFKKVTFVNDNFKNASNILDDLSIKEVDGILADLGVSSHQIDTASRGFSFRFDAPLDMRMNSDASFSAMDVVNDYSEADLKRVIKDFGEERFASSIARKIVNERKKSPIKTTKQLESIILSAVPKYKGNDGSSNVQRTFQAIRIEVNHELDGLKEFIKEMADRLKKGGRLAIISFHSLEDRIVKHTFRELATGCTCPSDFPICVCGNKPKVKIITNHPITATEEELKINRRSSSAKLRVIEKL